MLRSVIKSTIIIIIIIIITLHLHSSKTSIMLALVIHFKVCKNISIAKNIFMKPDRILQKNIVEPISFLWPWHDPGNQSQTSESGGMFVFESRLLYVEFVVEEVALGHISLLGFPLSTSFHCSILTHLFMYFCRCVIWAIDSLAR